MTNDQLDKNRLQILKDFLSTGEILHLENLEICITNSSAGLYHIFTFFGPDQKGEKYQKLHKDSITDKKLEEIARTLSIEEVKKIFIESRLLKRHNKLVKTSPFNPMDHENCS